ncbi:MULTISPECIES: PRD domain-containing protein [Cryobacterium]|uniref:PRD domain-containing protein n=2 Tax=Cryobacterium TaxID=69578 RepID=A0ABY2INZ6_9MICO|nr:MULTISPECIES: PRD domain-containing protein [Cryobacterium]TFC25012.1 PRD domain-containing protein [Cryobacterium sp. MDB1-18-2]TFC45778.1 PRD domain-containing protein [Cryobacterium sp. MDB1-18-1]TFB95305.1 PRD domain-containing protein [Cryobacterium sp. MDB2-A-1]TFC11340.1 PRD domain-containing protein [Cryobacterium sp. MDB2-A-2]TFC11637.1 PRD domain-containing protein [Cryobacterium sp. MDB2-33-2]
MDNRRTLSRPAHIIRYLETRLSASNDSLARRFGVGAKTIMNDIRDLNRTLTGTAAIELDSGRYRLFIIDRDGFSRIREELFERIDSFNLPSNRHGYIFRRLVQQTGPLLIDDLVEEMSIGRSTVTGDLGRLKAHLAPYALRITGIPNVGIELVGDELQVRLFVLENMFEAVYADYPLDDEFVEIIEDAAADYHLDGATTESLTRWFTVMIDRVLTEHGLTALPGRYLALTATPAFTLADGVVNAVGRRIQMSIPSGESIFLALPIAGMRTPTDARALEQFPSGTENEVLVQKILDRIDAEMDLHVPANALLKEFVHHITFMQNRMKYQVYVKDVALGDIEREYPVAFLMARIARRVIEQETSLRVVDDELGFIASYFQVFLEEQQVHREPRYRVAIVTTSGIVPARLIQVQLQKVMSGKTEYQILALDAAVPAVLDGFDLVVTTAWSELVTSTPIIELSEFFDNREILGRLTRLRYDKDVDVSLAAGADSILVSLLDRTRFFRLPPEQSYRENTAFMVGRLLAEGVVDAGFQDRLDEREAQSTMLLDDYVGFPHLGNALGNRVVFAMGVVPRASGEPGERVIFLLALPAKTDYDDTLLVRIYDEVIRLAGDHAELDLISQLASYEEFFFHMARTPSLSHKPDGEPR